MHPLRAQSKTSIKNKKINQSLNSLFIISIDLWTEIVHHPFKSSIKNLVDQAQGKARQWILVFSLEGYFTTWNLVFNSMLSKGRVKKYGNILLNMQIVSYLSFHGLAWIALFEFLWIARWICEDCVVCISMDSKSADSRSCTALPTRP